MNRLLAGGMIPVLASCKQTVSLGSVNCGERTKVCARSWT